ncbi:hypothetical protein ACFL2C_02300 [Patescibacteria group bacterium]
MNKSSFFRDKKGKVVIAQWPNWPLSLAIIFFVLQYVSNPVIQAVGFWGLITSLFYWSYLEIFHGVNTFRKVLGIGVAFSQILKVAILLVG